MDLREDQLYGIEWLAEHNRSFLADEMGVGKTAQLITAAIQVGARHILIVTPLAVVDHWKREIQQWASSSSSMIISPNNLPFNSLFDDPVFLVLNYDIIHKYGRELAQWADCFIVDECHYVMNNGYIVDVKSGKYSGVRRTAWVRLIASLVTSRGGRLWLASGTIMPARPSQLISQLVVLNRLDTTFGSWKDYVTHYCNGHQKWISTPRGRRKIWDLTGATNLSELNQKLSPFMLRRTRREVLPDITLMQPQILYTTLNGYEKEYDHAYSEIVNYVYTRYLQTDGEAEARLRAFKANAAQYIVTFTNLRRILANAKLEFANEWCKDWIESDRQLVVFAHHRAVIESLAMNLKDKAVVHYGGQSDYENRHALKEFHYGNAQFLIANTLSSGIGINLANASDVLFVEYEWTVNSHRQALDRCARPPQDEPVASYWITVGGTLDIELQQRISQQAIATDITMGDNIAGDIVAHLIKEREDHGIAES